MIKAHFHRHQGISQIVQPSLTFSGIYRVLPMESRCFATPRNRQQRFLSKYCSTNFADDTDVGSGGDFCCPFSRTPQGEGTEGDSTPCRTATYASHKLLPSPPSGRATGAISRDVYSMRSNTAMRGLQAAAPARSAKDTRMATTGASSAVPGAQSGKHEERQQLPQRVTAHPKLKEAIDTAGLTVYSSPLDRTSERVKARSQKVSRVLQRLCRCSWASVHRLLRLKKAFVGPQERSLAEHLKQVNDAKNRKGIASGEFLEPGATLYYPFLNRNNRISNSSTTTARHDCLHQQCAKQELVVFEDEDFIALNKPWGVSIGKLIQQLAIERPENSPISAEGAEAPIALTSPGHHCSGATLLCRSRTAASIVRKDIADGGFGTLEFIAVVEGIPLGHKGTVNIRSEQAIGAAVPAATHLIGSLATTNWKLLHSVKVTTSGNSKKLRSSLDWGDPRSLSILLLETGFDLRLHQIRSHCAFGLRCPLKGDRLYAQMLQMWQKTQQIAQRSGADGCLDAVDAELMHRKGVVALPLHLRRIQWRTFAGKDVAVEAPLGEHLLAALQAFGLYDRETIQKQMRNWLR